MAVSLKCLTRPIVVCPFSYSERLCQNGRGLSLDQTLTPRRVLNVNGSFMPPFHDPGRSERPGDESDMRHHSHESRALAAARDSLDKCGATHSGRFAPPGE